MPLGATEQAPGAIRTAASRDDPPAPLQTPQTGAQRKADMATARLSTPDDPPEREAIIRRIIRAELDALTERLIRDVQREDDNT